MSDERRCPYCDPVAYHPPERCPRVREIEYAHNGSIKRVVFMRPVDYMRNEALQNIKFT